MSHIQSKPPIYVMQEVVLKLLAMRQLMFLNSPAAWSFLGTCEPRGDYWRTEIEHRSRVV